jgi:hypothetical protein
MPALRLQLGTLAYDGLLRLARDPETATVSSVWAETLYPPVVVLLARQCPEYRHEVKALREGLARNTYTGPRVQRSRSIICPYCHDNAVTTGPFSADCQSCGTISPRRQR